MTKPITAAAAMILIEECKLRLDEPVDRCLRERIFGPLGMNDTGFSVPAQKLDRFVTGYSVNQQSGELDVYDEARGGQWSTPPAFPSGAGGLVSTVDDYCSFGAMML